MDTYKTEYTEIRSLHFFRNRFTLFILLPILDYYYVIPLQILHCIETN